MRIRHQLSCETANSNERRGQFSHLRSTTRDQPDESAWREVIDAVQRRIQERYLTPIEELARFDDEDELPYRPGFAILALDCLLIDTIQSFREGAHRGVVAHCCGN